MAAVLGLEAFAAVAAPFLDNYGPGGDIWLASGLALIAVITFLGLLSYTRLMAHIAGVESSRFGIREVIASTMVLVYLVLVVWTAFFVATAKQAEISRNLISNFTTLVGVVVGFYFGTAAIEAFRGRETDGRESTPRTPGDDEPSQTGR